MTEQTRSLARRWLPIALGVAHAAAFMAVLFAVHRFAQSQDDQTASDQSPWLPLLLAQAACAATLFGLGAGGIVKRFIWFAAALAIVLASFLAALSVSKGAATPLLEIDSLSANVAQWRTLLILIVIPTLCLGGLLQLLRLATGPVTADPLWPRESPKRLATETTAIGALIAAALAWGKWTIDQQEMTAFTSSALTANLTYLATQLIGAAAFAFASGGFWRIVGFTYVVCVAMQGFVNQESRDLSAFWSAAGPWILVLATFLALRWAGYLFAASRPAQTSVIDSAVHQERVETAP